jgi:pimeloyl-ACP methyl ester carboxylesterase
MSFDHATADLEPVLAMLDSRFPQTVVVLPSGARLAVRTAGPAPGDAPVIVLLHGIGSGAASWLHVALALGTRARVVAWDAPGYGDSTALAPAAPTAADYAQRLHELLIALQIDGCVLVGHSLGALMAAAFAAGQGGGVAKRLVLISPARGYGSADRAASGQQVLDARLGTLRRRGIQGMASDSSDRMLSAAATPAARAWVQWNAARLTPAGYTQAVRMLCGADIERHAPVAMPVEVLCGDADTVTPPEACAQVASRFGTRLCMLSQAGHASPVEQPILVARRIAGAADLLPGDPQS